MSIESPFLGECITYFHNTTQGGLCKITMSETYYLLAAIFVWHFLLFSSYSLGLVATLTLDVDLDGELDMDVSDIVSFKGLVHFVMGASGWLCIKHSVSHSIEWYDYLIALICGILFVVILYYLYKLCFFFKTPTSSYS